MALRDNAPEIGHDALDGEVGTSRWVWFPPRGAALGLRASAAPSLAFITIGFALGPAVLDVLDVNALARLDVVVSVALAALGVFVGLGIGGIGPTATLPLLLGALVQAVLTIATVAGGLYLLLERWRVPLSLDVPVFVTALGVCACASAATRARGASATGTGASMIVDLDDVPLILLGTLLVIGGGGASLGTTVAISLGTSALVGLAGWLLFERAESKAQRGVFVTGTLVLLGGIGAYAGASPLFCGCIAAVIWRRTAGAADRIIEDDIGKLQHPLVALLLIVAGASIQVSMALLWIAAPLVLLRLIGKLLGGTAAAHVTGLPVGLLVTLLLPPGVLGIALALNLYQVHGDAGGLLLSGVTVSAAASELLAMLLPAGPEETH